MISYPARRSTAAARPGRMNAGRLPVSLETSCHLQDGKHTLGALKVQRVSAGGLTVLLDRMVPSGKVVTAILSNPVRRVWCRRRLLVLYTFRDPHGAFCLGGLFDRELRREEWHGLLEGMPLPPDESFPPEPPSFPLLEVFEPFCRVRPGAAAAGALIETYVAAHGDRPQAAAAAGLPGRTVLIVENQAVTCRALAVILKSEGYAVTAAASGREALQSLRAAAPPDCVLLDVVAPVPGARWFVEQHGHEPGLAAVPLVLMTGSGIPTGWAASLGAVGFIRKPINVECLLDLLQRCG